MTKVLAFPVSCTYDDNFMLDLDPIHLDAGITDIDGIHENGDVCTLRQNLLKLVCKQLNFCFTNIF